MPAVIPIPAFNDNYIWLIISEDKQRAIVIDPGDATPVIAYCETQQIQPIAILITHHHHDHTGGIEKLVEQYQLPVYGSAQEKISYCSHPCQANDQLDFPTLDKLKLNIIETPGHTLGHISFYGNGWLFCGDTLFAGGCGRIFEGTPTMMLHSLNQLKQLPENTEIYCAHEYTLANLTFANEVDPDNPALKKRLQHIQQLRQQHQITLPAILSTEKATNPFLRSDTLALQQWAQQHTKAPPTELDTFKQLRQFKDNWRFL
jgi:hydroxyacylglutathione hydrolase